MQTSNNDAILFSTLGIPRQQPRGKPIVINRGDGKVRGGIRGPAADHPVNAFKYEVKQRCLLAMGDRGPITGPVDINVAFYFPNARKLKRTMPDGWRTKKPDLDNLTKSVMDALKGVAWVDDAQVVRLVTLKLDIDHRETPGVVVRIEPLAEQPDFTLLPRPLELHEAAERWPH